MKCTAMQYDCEEANQTGKTNRQTDIYFISCVTIIRSMNTYYAVIVYSDIIMNVVRGHSCLIPQSTVIPSLVTTPLSQITGSVATLVDH